MTLSMGRTGSRLGDAERFFSNLPTSSNGCSRVTELQTARHGARDIMRGGKIVLIGPTRGPVIEGGTKGYKTMGSVREIPVLSSSFHPAILSQSKMADIKNEEIIQNDDASAVEANLKGVSEHPLAPGTEKRIAVEKKLKRKLDAR